MYGHRKKRSKASTKHHKYLPLSSHLLVIHTTQVKKESKKLLKKSSTMRLKDKRKQNQSKNLSSRNNKYVIGTRKFGLNNYNFVKERLLVKFCMRFTVIKSQPNNMKISKSRFKGKLKKSKKSKRSGKKKPKQVEFDMVKRQESFNIVTEKTSPTSKKQARNCPMLESAKTQSKTDLTISIVEVYSNLES